MDLLYGKRTLIFAGHTRGITSWQDSVILQVTQDSHTVKSGKNSTTHGSIMRIHGTSVADCL